MVEAVRTWEGLGLGLGFGECKMCWATYMPMLVDSRFAITRYDVKYDL